MQRQSRPALYSGEYVPIIQTADGTTPLVLCMWRVVKSCMRVASLGSCWRLSSCMLPVKSNVILFILALGAFCYPLITVSSSPIALGVCGLKVKRLPGVLCWEQMHIPLIIHLPAKRINPNQSLFLYLFLGAVIELVNCLPLGILDSSVQQRFSACRRLNLL